MKENFINTALNEVGYREGPNNDNKYGAYFSCNNQPWCAFFVSWCARQSNIPTDIILTYAGCGTGYNFFKDKGAIYDSYNCRAGDIVFWKPTKAGCVSAHTGIVVEVTEDKIITVEGNSNDRVAKNTYSKNYDKFLGFGRPAYIDEPIPVESTHVTYQVYDNVKKKWLNPITDCNDTNIYGYAGNFKNAIGGIRAKLSDDSIIRMRTHIKGGYWLSEITAWNDTNNGYSGIKGKNIDGVAIKCDNHRIQYRVHLRDENRYLAWVEGYDVNNLKTGMAGNLGAVIDAIQIRIVD